MRLHFVQFFPCLRLNDQPKWTLVGLVFRSSPDRISTCKTWRMKIKNWLRAGPSNIVVPFPLLKFSRSIAIFPGSFQSCFHGKSNSTTKVFLMKMEISEIRITPIKQRQSLVAFASCVVDRQFYFGGIAIHCDLTNHSFRLVFPTKKFPNREEVPLYHPINKEAYNHIQKAIVIQWENLIKREYF